MTKGSVFCIVSGVWLMGLASAQAQGCKLGVDPATVQTSDSQSPPWTRGFDNVGLYGCSIVNNNNIKCLLTWTRTRDGAASYGFDNGIACVLRDNLKIEHKAVRMYALNGHCQPQKSVTLEKDEAMWFAIEFAGDTEGVSKGLISCIPTDMRYGDSMYLRLSGKIN